MKLDDLKAEMAADSVIDKANLDNESVRIPVLHSKWYNLFIEEIKALKIWEQRFKDVKKERSMLYLGLATDEELRANDMNRKILKADLDLYLDADEKIKEVVAKLEFQRIKVKLCEDFIKTINNRSFQIKHAIDFMMFMNGKNG